MGPAAPSGLSWRVGGRARAEKPGKNRPARPRAASLGVRPPLPLPRACAGDGLLLLLVAGSASRSALALAWIALRTSLDERPRPRPVAARPPLIPGSCRGALPLRWLSAPPPSPRAFDSLPPPHAARPSRLSLAQPPPPTHPRSRLLRRRAACCRLSRPRQPLGQPSSLSALVGAWLPGAAAASFPPPQAHCRLPPRPPRPPRRALATGPRRRVAAVRGRARHRPRACTQATAGGDLASPPQLLRCGLAERRGQELTARLRSGWCPAGPAGRGGRHVRGFKVSDSIM